MIRLASIYAQLNGAVQHPHSSASLPSCRKPRCADDLWFIRLKEMEALENEMHVARIIRIKARTVTI